MSYINTNSRTSYIVIIVSYHFAPLMANPQLCDARNRNFEILDRKAECCFPFQETVSHDPLK